MNTREFHIDVTLKKLEKYSRTHGENLVFTPRMLAEMVREDLDIAYCDEMIEDRLLVRIDDFMEQRKAGLITARELVLRMLDLLSTDGAVILEETRRILEPDDGCMCKELGRTILLEGKRCPSCTQRINRIAQASPR